MIGWIRKLWSGKKASEDEYPDLEDDSTDYRAILAEERKVWGDLSNEVISLRNEVYELTHRLDDCKYALVTEQNRVMELEILILNERNDKNDKES